MMCLFNIYFQNTNTHLVCRRKLLFQHLTPTLQHHKKIWIFFFPTRHQISLRCTDTSDQIHRMITIYGAGILHNTSECHITTDEISISPNLRGTSVAELDIPKFYLPDNIACINKGQNFGLICAYYFNFCSTKTLHHFTQ